MSLKIIYNLWIYIYRHWSLNYYKFHFSNLIWKIKMANGLSNYHLIKMKYKWKYYKLYEKFNQSKSSFYLYLNIVLCVYIYLISLSDLPQNKTTIIKYRIFLSSSIIIWLWNLSHHNLNSTIWKHFGPRERYNFLYLSQLKTQNNSFSNWLNYFQISSNRKFSGIYVTDNYLMINANR